MVKHELMDGAPVKGDVRMVIVMMRVLIMVIMMMRVVIDG